MSHRVMTGLPDLELAEELAASRDALRRISGQPVEAIAYPRGRVDARVAVAAAAAGYRLGFALSAPAGGVKGVSPRMLIRRTALYAPDQIPGLFEATSLAGFPPLRALRSGLGRAGGSLILAALRMRGRAHG
jgi:peptidoglycan/xylan/chitin deacetylase (PgdA/CDA1 family)